MKNLKPLFDFDDILIVPSPTTKINSRYNNIFLPELLPLFTAPMDTVVDLSNINEYKDNGIGVVLPRTIKYEDYLNYVENTYNTKCSDYEKYKKFISSTFISMGFGEIEYHLNKELRLLHSNQCLLIDVANGHMEKLLDYCIIIKKLRPDIKLMVGNIANPETYLVYAKANCIDYIRVGIGNGGGCLTTKQSGVGYPMASLIKEIYDKKTSYTYDHRRYENFKLPAIVADGGMKDHSDIIKALALGADYVMIGSIFNKALESCAQNYFYNIKINKKTATFLFDKGYPIKKHFRGMSTKQAQKAMGKKTFKTSEGVVRYRKVEYHLSSWTENFIHYLRNAMSYSNSDNLNDFIGNNEICQITKSAYDRFNK